VVEFAHVMQGRASAYPRDIERDAVGCEQHEQGLGRLRDQLCVAHKATRRAKLEQ